MVVFIGLLLLLFAACALLFLFAFIRFVIQLVWLAYLWAFGSEKQINQAYVNTSVGKKAWKKAEKNLDQQIQEALNR